MLYTLHNTHNMIQLVIVFIHDPQVAHTVLTHISRINTKEERKGACLFIPFYTNHTTLLDHLTEKIRIITNKQPSIYVLAYLNRIELIGECTPFESRKFKAANVIVNS